MIRNTVRTLGLALLLTTAGGVIAQDYNRLDAQGRKQGPFKKYFEGTEQVFYTGEFKDDIPQGTFTYYYRSGEKKAEMAYQDNGKVTYNTSYYTSGNKMAEGKYIQRAKDSVWTYYDETGAIRSRESWKSGQKHGEEISYFPDGKTAETLNWVDSLREGTWIQYHPNGNKYIEASFANDVYDGEMTFYFENGKKEIQGRYANGLRTGPWYYFNENGSIRMQALYRGGELEKEKWENGTFKEYGPYGETLSEVIYKNGLKEGPFTEFHDDTEIILTEERDPRTGEMIPTEIKEGNELKRRGEYKADQLHGMVEYFDTNGNLIRSERYVDGILQE